MNIKGLGIWLRYLVEHKFMDTVSGSWNKKPLTALIRVSLVLSYWQGRHMSSTREG